MLTVAVAILFGRWSWLACLGSMMTMIIRVYVYLSVNINLVCKIVVDVSVDALVPHVWSPIGKHYSSLIIIEML